jgi:uncharacterized protein YndB with AHSA1/START domain
MTLSLTAKGEREIVITRSFDAPRALVFDALTRPDMIRNWMLGPDGWTMPVCEVDLRAGGTYRFVWHSEACKMDMGVRGTYREAVRPELIVHTEIFDQPWYPGTAIITTVLAESGNRTHLTTTIRYESRDARDGVLKSPMEGGISASYDRLESLLATAVR